MKRIFYYSGYRLTVFHWLNDKLIDSYAFNPGDDGFEKFKTYLLATENSPARILVDLIEEDFNQESIPHVGVIDRKSIVGRLVERNYRTSRDYVHSTVLGREKTGRKDDIILYSVLSNPEILEPWLKIIRESSTIISGIWSLPLISIRFFEKLKLQSNNAILVTQQVPSNIRQSFFKNGKFKASRSAVVNLQESSFGENISNELEQTIRFLSNQRELGFDEKIDAHIICRLNELDEIKVHCTDTNLLQHHFHNIEETSNIFNFKADQTDYCNAIFSHICASEVSPIGHYGNKELFFKYYEHIASSSLYITSLVLFILSIVLSFSFISDSKIYDSESVTLNDRATYINKEYQKNLAQIEKRLGQTTIMKSSVLFTEKVRLSRSISPQNFMVDISHILSSSDARRANITDIKWTQIQSNTLPSTQTNNKSNAIDYGDPTEINQSASIGGFISISQSSLKHSVDTTNSIASAFRNHPDTKQLIIERIPLDVRPESSIEKISHSSSNNNLLSDQTNGQFEIKILMQGRKL